jgi:phosphatidylinositol glycan class N
MILHLGLIAHSKQATRIIALQAVILAAATWTVNSTSASLRAKQGLPLLNQLLAWILSGASLAIPIVVTNPTLHRHWLIRLLSLHLAFATPFTLLTVSYESLFYYVYSLVLLIWLLLERKCYQATVLDPNRNEEDVTRLKTEGYPNRHLRLGDLRTSIFFLTFLLVAFFGTGNVASVASFTVESVTRFRTVFSPFLMGALLVFKILIPFLVLSSFYSVLSRAVDLPPFALFLLTVTTTDVMTLNFFYMVRDTGAWLDIGESISHFVIASALSVFSMVLFWISHKIVGQVLIPQRSKTT